MALVAYVDSLIRAHTNTAIAKVNAEQLQMYWEIGGYISQHLKDSSWGDHVVSELADYLKRQNPVRKGCSKRNLYNMVLFYEAYSSQSFYGLVEQLQLSDFVQSQTAQIASKPIVQMPSAQLQDGRIPALLALTTFSNHVEILNRCSSYEERVFYVLYSAEHHLTYQELRRCIVNQTYDSIMSKEKMMNPALLKQYPGAEYMLKDRVLVDFLQLKPKHTEPQLHSSILENMKRFILELGKSDFLYIDDEFTVKVGNKIHIHLAHKLRLEIHRLQFHRHQTLKAPMVEHKVYTLILVANLNGKLIIDIQKIALANSRINRFIFSRIDE